MKEHESIADPFVSFDGDSVYFAKMHNALKHKGSDLYKVHVPTRKITPDVELCSDVWVTAGSTIASPTRTPVFGSIAELGPSSCPVNGFSAWRFVPVHGFALLTHPAAYRTGAVANVYWSGRKFDACRSLSYCAC